MVFNPEQQAGDGGNFLGFSRGQQADRSAATLFKAGTDAVKTGIAIKETATANSINEEVASEVDRVRDEALGVDNLPADAQRELTTAERISRARAGGGLTDSHYYNRLDVIARKLRSRYPQHRDQIDKRISGLTGITPANALRKALQAEVSAQQSAAAKREGEIKQASARGLIDSSFLANIGTKSPQQIAMHINQNARLKTELSNRKAQVELSLSNNRLNKVKATDNARFELNAVVSRGVDEVLAPIQDLITKAQQDPASLTAEEKNTIRQTVGQATLGVDNLAQQVLNAPNERGFSYAQVIPDKDKQAIISGVKSYVTSLGNSLVEGNFGAFNAKKNSIKALIEDGEYDLVTNSKTIQTTKILDTQPKAVQDIAYADQEFQAGVSSALKVNLFSDIVGEGKSIDFVLSSAEGAKLEPKDRMDLVDMGIKAITAEDVDLNDVERYADAMFGSSDFITKTIKQGDQASVLSRMANPRVHARMMSIRDKGRPDLYNKYRTWLTRSWVGAVKNDLDEVNNINKNRIDFKVKYNPSTAQFESVDRDTPNLGPRTGSRSTDLTRDAIARLFESTGNRDTAEESLKNLNLLMSSITPMFRAEGLDPAEQIMELLVASGYNPNAEPEGPGITNFFDVIGNSVREFVGVGEE